MIMIRGHFGHSVIHEITSLHFHVSRSAALRQVGMVSPRLPAAAEVESLKLDQSLLALLTSAWFGHRRPHTVRDGTSVTLWKTWARCTPARSLQCRRICSKPHLPNSRETIFQKGAFSTAYQIAVGLCTVATEAEVVVDKVQVSAVRRVKMSALIDPLDDSEVPAAASGQIEEWYRNYKVIKFGHPLPDKEPTPDQLIGDAHEGRGVQVGTVRRLQHPHAARVTNGEEPQVPELDPTSRWYVPAGGAARPRVAHDVGGVPCGLGCSATRQTRSDQPAQVLTPIAIETYLEAIRQLCKEHPECWHLCLKAEDRCRAEHLSRVARTLKEEKGRQVTWSEELIHVSQDDCYWDREVRRPVIGFLHAAPREASATSKRTLWQCLLLGAPGVAEQTVQDLANK